ncbi:hypothetical protein MAR_012109 [Mya arenaria]|uniref:Uncharacterized protein n=1 Tax=Mya arenaria TaxID=6604 RepID=A0ABY7FW40_MYAAR|nr:hypothetical protein MAR_012109 [Mya arenaria]
MVFNLNGKWCYPQSANHQSYSHFMNNIGYLGLLYFVFQRRSTF